MEPAGLLAPDSGNLGGIVPNPLWRLVHLLGTMKNAQGEITIDGQTNPGMIEEDASVFAPLPLIGFDFWFAFTPKWSLSTKIGLVGGSYQDLSAGVLQTIVNAKYQFTRHLGALVGLTYFDADVKIDDSEERIDISYGYDGAFFGLHLTY